MVKRPSGVVTLVMPFDEPFGFSEQVSFVYAGNSQTFNFTGVKIGDVNGSYNSESIVSSEERSRKDLNILIKHEEISKGTKLTFYVDKGLDLTSLQFALNFNESIDVKDIERGLLPLSKSNVGLSGQNEGIIKLSYYNIENISIQPEEPLFSIIIDNKMLDQISIADETMSSEIRDAIGEQWDIEGLLVKSEIGAESKYTFAHSFFPNPFSDLTVLQYENTEQEHGNKMQIFDVAGKLVRIIEINTEIGKHQIEINSAMLKGIGMYYYVMETNVGAYAGKFLYSN